MGTYLNPGKAAYEEAVNSEIFVDKTEMIGYLNSVARTKKKYVCVSRPRRFGKTMAADMLCAYYDRKAESRELFEKRKIAVCATALAREREVPWDEYMGQFDVIRLVMTDFFKSDQSIADALDTIKVRVLDELEECYPGTKYDVKDFPFSMDKFYRKSGRQFVIVIDEWDAVFRMLQDDAEGQRKYLDFLRDWLKDKVSHLATSLLDTAKNALGIGSPSRKFRDEVGRWIMPGVGQGIVKSMPNIMKTVRDSSTALVDEMQTAVNASLGDVNMHASAALAGTGGGTTVYNDNRMEQNNTYNVPTATPSEVARTQRDAMRRIVGGVK